MTDLVELLAKARMGAVRHGRWAAQISPVRFNYEGPPHSFIVEWARADGAGPTSREVVRGMRALLERIEGIEQCGFARVVAFYVLGQLDELEHSRLAATAANVSECAGPEMCHGVQTHCGICGDTSNVCNVPDCPVHFPGRSRP